MPGPLNPNVIGLSPLAPGVGLAPFGLRHSGEGAKGRGYFGPILNPQGGYSSELSSEFTQGGRTIEHPLMVPTLTAEELRQVLSGNVSPEIYSKAQAFALGRIEAGKSPFAGSGDLRLPIPNY